MIPRLIGSGGRVRNKGWAGSEAALNLHTARPTTAGSEGTIMTAKRLLLVAVVAACGMSTARAGWNPFGGGKVPNPLNDAKNQAEQEARRLREERDRAARTAEEQARRVREARDRAAREAEEVARKARETRERVAQEAAKVDELRRRAEAEVTRFKKIRQDVERAVAEYDRLQRLAGGDDARLRDEAYRQLRAAGVMGSNQAEVKKKIERGFGHTLWGKEFDHIEQQKFAMALAASAASGNPGPALAYVKQYAADTKKTLLAQLKAAPKEVQQKAEAEFERLLVDALDKAVRNGKVPELRFGGVTLTVGMATYNHWCAVKYQEPQLVETQKVFGVQLYEVRFKPQEKRIPLPNTCQPYVRVEVKASVR